MSVKIAPVSAERDRLHEVPHGRSPWRRWGPYLAERAWGTVREDYSPDGEAWTYFPYDQARSRAYRWSEDGLAGICDDRQLLCLALALHNGRDPHLKERAFGLAGPEGNHGEDVKEYWWYLDCTPTHSWMRWRYMYPQAEFPYDRLRAENRSRDRSAPEFELLDTGVFDEDRYWEITADYAKASPEELLMRITVRNAGPEEATLDVLPSLWFRNTWSYELLAERPSIRLREDGALLAQHHELGARILRDEGEGAPTALFCENDTNLARVFGVSAETAYPKDGINDHVVSGAPTVNPAHEGTKAALRYTLTVAPGETAEIRLRLGEADGSEDFETVMTARRREADAFYTELTPAATSGDEALILRQAFAGMLWSKQFFHYNVRRWLDGDPAYPPPPPERLTGRNHEWASLNNLDVISMPDKWEYPWYATWDLAFHCVALAHVDPEFAKSQLVLLGREWYMHPNGQLPAYEWNFSDVNPPVQAWAALRVYEIAGDGDIAFLERVFHKLLLNFTWWVNRKDADGDNLFEGGFLGLDNIGVFDRSVLPIDGLLEQSDGTAWMAMYCADLLELALVLAHRDPVYEDLATKFLEHFALIAAAVDDKGLWDEQDGFFYDVLKLHGSSVPLRGRSIAGLLPLAAVSALGHETLAALPDFAVRMQWFTANRPEGRTVHARAGAADTGERLLSIVDAARLRRLLGPMLSSEEFLSEFGLRGLSRYHRDHPLHVDLDNITATLDYEPGESTTPMFGGNSNWRGPVWFPLNYLLIGALRVYHRFLGEQFTVPCPTDGGPAMTLGEVADELSARLIGLFTRRADGSRAVFGSSAKLNTDPAWRDLVPFHEYFHGETGAGLGASHQTGWTGLVANLIIERGRREP